MATVRRTQRDFWMNRDGSIANIVYTPINPNAEFSIETFIQKFTELEFLKNANKAQLSQAIFGNNRLESANDQEFNKFKGNFNRDIVQEGFNKYVVNKSPELISLVNQITPEQAERIILNKNRNAKTSAFRINAAENASETETASVNSYNSIIDEKDIYHAETTAMEEQGDSVYCTRKLGNINAIQWAVILAATGSRPGDFTKISKAYKNLYASRVLEKVRTIGVVNYVGTNIRAGKMLEEGHKRALQNLETVVEEQIIQLGVGATDEEKKAIYQEQERQKVTILGNYQNAGSDAKYLFTDLANKANDATVKLARYNAAQAQRQAN